MSTQQKHVEIFLEEDLDATQRSLLGTRLEKERGIVRAWFEGGDQHRLSVHYERDHFSDVTLMDTIKDFGYHGRIIH